FGPGTVIAAAFIGPGTVTTCSVAGLKFGYSLLWAMMFSVFATIILQEMSSRLGLIGQIGLGTAIRKKYVSRIEKLLMMILVISALGIGCAAYESGNISGAALGIEAITGMPVNILSLFVGILAFLLLWRGKYKIIESFLVSLVVIMGFTFIIASIVIKPDFSGIIKGLVPAFDKDSLYVSIGLIGTTVVPYNIFLHASIVRNKWKNPESLNDCRKDLIFSIILGGIISSAIIVTSAEAFFGSGIKFENAGQMAVQLQPLLGTWSKWFFATGLFAAGVSSAITAPLAASFAISEILGWSTNLKSIKLRFIWIVVLLTGVVFSVIGFKPIPLILFAQVTNGLLLSVIAVVLILVVNDKKLLRENANSKIQNLFGIIVVLIAFFLGFVNILKVLKVF
ncbi:divalent metal cation transporter, partial [candidate division KSB1 bacterium]